MNKYSTEWSKYECRFRTLWSVHVTSFCKSESLNLLEFKMKLIAEIKSHYSDEGQT